LDGELQTLATTPKNFNLHDPFPPSYHHMHMPRENDLEKGSRHVSGTASLIRGEKKGRGKGYKTKRIVLERERERIRVVNKPMGLIVQDKK
jgi:hypothetical protein